MNINDFAFDYGFPLKPDVPSDFGPEWFTPEKREDISNIIPAHAEIIVEIGSFLGRSAKAMADIVPAAWVVCIDHWKGSAEHQTNPNDMKYLPKLYETFIVNMWEYRERLIPLRMTALEGMVVLQNHNIKPDFIFVDGSHDYQSVTQDLVNVTQMFPGAIICGDDYQWESVGGAVRDFARTFGRDVKVTPANLFWFENHP